MPKTLLLADDSVTIQKVVGISFASEDVELVTVDNGDSALERARALRPDVVLADVVMPGKNGYEVCEAIKADPALRHIPVLLLTGTFEAFDEERARRCGAAGHVSKPFEAQSLVQRVRQLLTRPPAAVEPAPAARPAAAAPASSPKPTAAPPAPSAPEIASDGFEFFDDEIAELSAPELQPRDAASADDSDFSFGADALELASSATPASRTAAAAGRAQARATRDVLAEPELSSELFGDTDGETTGESISTLSAELLDDSEAPLAEPDLAEDSFAFAAPAAAPLAPATAAPVRAAATPPREAGATQIFEAPRRTPVSAPLDPVREPETVAWIDADPEASDAFDVSERDLGDSLDLDTAPSPSASSALDRSAPFDFEAPADGSADFDSTPLPLETPRSPLAAANRANEDAAALGPALRAQLHDTIERAAWETFGPLSEEIVKQVVQRFEAIAWEVVPQMAEKMISDMLARVSGEGEDER